MDIKFYILVIIAWLIFNIVRAVRKANAASSKTRPGIPPVTSPRNTEFGRSLEELFNPSAGKQAAKPVPSQEAYPSYGSQEEIIDETRYDSEALYSKEAYAAYQSQESITEEEQHYTIEGGEEAGTDGQQSIGKSMQTDDKSIDFDLRRAVIYSEILRRPYV